MTNTIKKIAAGPADMIASVCIAFCFAMAILSCWAETRIKDGVAADQLTTGKAGAASSTAAAATPSSQPDPMQSFLFVQGHGDARAEVAAKVFAAAKTSPNSKVVVVGRPDDDAKGALLRAIDFTSFLVKAHPIDARQVSVMVDAYAEDGCIQPLDYCAALRRGVDIYVTQGATNQ